MLIKFFVWNAEKDEWLRQERNVSFREIIAQLAKGGLLDVVPHPRQEKYRGQRMFIVKMRDYVWLIPFVETDTEVFLKTVIPSRKATAKYLRGKSNG